MLINCPECTGRISNEAFVCPHCGYRLHKPNAADQALRRSMAETEVQNDRKKAIDHLLRDINEESLDKTRPESETVARTMSRFAALLTNLSAEGARTANSNLKLQKFTFGTAIVALLISLSALAFQIIDYREKMHEKPEGDVLQVRFQRTYTGEELKKYEEVHQIPAPFPEMKRAPND